MAFLVLIFMVAAGAVGIAVLGIVIFMLFRTVRWVRDSRPRDTSLPTDSHTPILSADSFDASVGPPPLPGQDADDDSILRRGSLGHDVLHPSSSHPHLHATDPGTCADPAASSSDSSSWSDPSPSCGGSDSGGGGSSGSSD
jgi:uncharacterized membrane protein YgcG